MIWVIKYKHMYKSETKTNGFALKNITSLGTWEVKIIHIFFNSLETLNRSKIQLHTNHAESYTYNQTKLIDLPSSKF